MTGPVDHEGLLSAASLCNWMIYGGSGRAFNWNPECRTRTGRCKQEARMLSASSVLSQEDECAETESPSYISLAGNDNATREKHNRQDSIATGRVPVVLYDQGCRC